METRKIPWLIAFGIILDVVARVIAQNNAVPTFSQSVYEVDLQENTVVGTTVVTANATDSDTGPAGEVDYSLRGTTNFEINQNGDILTKIEMDFENEAMRGLQEFTVVATDRGATPKSSEAQVKVQLTNENEHGPRFTMQIFEGSVQHEDPRGTEVLIVSAEDRDEGAELLYTLPELNSPYFDIDSRTGRMTVNKTIDRPQLLQDFNVQGDAIQVKVRVTDGHFLVITRVFIIVYKKNYFAPKFDLSDYSGEVTEESRGKNVVRVTATDDDGQSVTYELLDPVLSGKFSIDKYSGQIRLIRSIDRESLTSDVLELKVLAKDDDDRPPVKNATTTVRIRVLDINDNVPIYGEPSFEIKLPQDFGAGVEATLPEATDKDIGDNAKIVYQLASADQKYFTIDSATSKLTTTKACGNDCIKTVDCRWMQITVFAFNEGLPVPNNSLTVNVTLITLGSAGTAEPVSCDSAPIPNKYPPVFTSQNYEGEVPENSPSNTVVLTVSTTDDDFGISAQVEYSITNSSDFGINNDGVIYTQKVFDYENPEERTLCMEVEAVDKGIPSKKSTSVVCVSIVNRNDNPPSFPETLYEATIRDGDPENKVIIEMDVQDDDGTASIVYDLPDSNPYFKIDPTSGVVSVAKMINKADILQGTTGDTITLRVRANDGDFTAETQLKLTINTSNEFAPVFARNDYNTTVVENSSGQAILTVTATDDDIHRQALQYSLLTSPMFDYCSIGQTTGEITMAKPIDREMLTADEKSGMELTVHVTDNGLPQPKTATTVVIVYISDINDNIPKFDPTNQIIRLPQIFALNQSFDLQQATDPDFRENAVISYELLETEANQYFTVDRGTGKITTKISCDKTCTRLVDCTLLTFSLIAFNENKPMDRNTLTVQVIADSPETSVRTTKNIPGCQNAPIPNRHDPEFTKTKYDGEVDENSPRDTLVATVNATDGDFGDSADVTYTITNSTDFRINDKGEIYTVKHLDYENPDDRTICLEVEARDGGDPVRTATTVVCVQVNNLNDNPPKFPDAGYDASVSNGDPQNKVVIEIQATDKDGDVGGITYELPDANPYFQIDPTTGIITVAQSIDRVKILEDISGGDTITLTVRAKNGGYTVDTVLRLKINTSNEHNPVFAMNDYNTTVEEESSGDVILTVTATDNDVPKHVIHYSLMTSDMSDSFSIGQTTGEIRVIKSIDRETLTVDQKNGIALTIRVTDNGLPEPKTVTTVVIVHIADINDKVPQFGVSETIIRLSQRFSAGEVFDLPQASDDDIGANAVVKYRLSGPEANAIFTVNEDTGQITTKDSCSETCIRVTDCIFLRFSLLAYNEDKPNITRAISVEVIAETPETTARLTNNIPLCENVSIPNNHSPAFTKTKYEGEVNENTPPNRVVVTVQADDGDFGPSSDVTYRITNNTDFGINGNGEIYTVNDLDYENENQRIICMEVVATDKGSPARSNKTVVCIVVNNLDDNPPTFPGTGYEASIRNGDPRGKVVTEINALDEDGFDGITYQLLKGNQFFQIDRATGIITISQKINKAQVLQGISGDTIVLRVRATDSALHTAETQIRLTINSTNDFAPTFTSPSYRASVIEETSDVELLTVSANDHDIPAQNIRYHLLQTDMSGNFSVHESSGILKVTQPIDRESLSAQNRLGFQLTILASDDGLPLAKTATVPVNIEVLDINDNIPQFGIDTTDIHLSQTYVSGEVVQLPIASDADVGGNADISYRLSGNAEELFSLDKDTGQLQTKSDCDKCIKLSDCQLLKFTVWAYNEDKPSSTDALTVNVVLRKPGTASNTPSSQLISCMNATEPNNFDPTFPETKYEGSVTEHTNPDTVIFVVNATDKDHGNSGDLTYDITNSTDFRINEDGEIITVQDLDYENVEDRYKCIEVVATDRGTPKRSSSTVVCLTVTNINDNGPKFTEPLYIAEVQDGDEPETWVLQMSATDEDHDSVVTYNFVVANEYFQIDAKSGNVTVAKKINRQEILKDFPSDSVILSVLATDTKNPVTVQLRIKVQPKNQFYPAFTMSTYRYSVDEELFPATVGNVLATDADLPIQVIQYRIVSADIPGIVEAFLIDSMSGQISVKKRIDRETLSSDVIELTVEAVDNGVPPPKRSSTAKVQVTVRDINDNVPQFGIPSTELRLLQNYTSGQIHAMQRATDKDISDTIVYELSSNARHLFSINRLTGALTTLTTCDGSCLKLVDCTELQFNISAYNEDKPQQPFRSTLAISLTLVTLETGSSAPAPGTEPPLCSVVPHVNKHDPKFTETKYEGRVPESSPPNTVVVTVSTTDDDFGDSGDVDYRITNSTDFGINKTGEIFTKTDLNYEDPAQRQICVEVVATDRGAPPRSTTTVVCVNVVDVNDNPPKFPPQEYRASIEDGAKRGAWVMTISATDDDIGSGISYSFASPNAHFQIDSKSGNVSTSQTIDIEDIMRSYGSALVTIDILATDSKFTDDSKLQITIVRKNDHSPVFTQTIYDADVDEETSNVHVIRVSASDQDLSTEVIKYQILSATIPGVFSIDGNTGVITLVGKIDRENLTSDVVDVVVVAIDSGVPPPKRTSTVTVRVRVNDVNDHVPKFDVTSFDLRIYQNFSAGDDFVLPKAVDPDSGDTILYDLSPEANSFFILDTTTWIVRTRQNCGESCVKLEDCRQLEFTLWAYNVDKPSDRGELRVNVSLLTTETDNKIVSTSDVPVACSNAMGPNKHDPKFSKPMYEGNVTENSTPGTVVVVVNSTDGDTGKSGEVEYRITNSTDFKVNEDGEITTKTSLDYEKTNGEKICFEVLAIDRGRPRKTATTVVCVDVVNVNDNTPEFTGQMTAGIQDGSDPGTSVTKVTARDDDPDSVITFEFVTPNEYFNIDKIMGVITVAKTINRSEIVTTTGTSIISLRVIASDSVNQLEGRLLITVTRINEHVPVFTRDVYPATVDEEATNVHVITVKADDPDLPRNPVTYLIPSSNISDHFTINAQTGEIRLVKSFDRENLAQDVLYLAVVAVDTGNPPPRSSTATVRIIVADINDHPPRFLENYVEIRLLQNFTAGEVRQLPKATDLDVGENSRITYHLSEGGYRYFALDENDATLTTRIKCRECLSDQAYDFMILTVSAFNADRPTVTDVLQVKVILMPVDYVAPPVTGEVTERREVEVNRNYAKPRDLVFTVPVRARASADDMKYYMSAENDNHTLDVFDITENGRIILKYVPQRLNQTKYIVKFMQSENGNRNITYHLVVTFIDDTHLDEKGIAAITAICFVVLLIIILIIVHLVWWKTRHKKEKEENKNCILESGSSGTSSEELGPTGFSAFKPAINYKYNNNNLHESILWQPEAGQAEIYLSLGSLPGSMTT